MRCAAVHVAVSPAKHACVRYPVCQFSSAVTQGALETPQYEEVGRLVEIDVADAQALGVRFVGLEVNLRRSGMRRGAILLFTHQTVASGGSGQHWRPWHACRCSSSVRNAPPAHTPG